MQGSSSSSCAACDKSSVLIFFSSARFPEVVQPFIQALPLTQLNDALREVMLEGHGLDYVAWRLGILLAWGLGTFVLALLALATWVFVPLFHMEYTRLNNYLQVIVIDIVPMLFCTPATPARPLELARMADEVERVKP